MTEWNRKARLYTLINLNSRWRFFWNYVIRNKPLTVEIAFWTSDPKTESELILDELTMALKEIVK